MKGLASLLTGLGLVATLFGLLSAGIALFQPVTDKAWIFGNLGVGLLLLLVGFLLGFERFRGRLRSGEAA